MERLASNDNVTLSLATSARLLSFEDIGSAWSQELKNRANSTDMVRPAQSKSGGPVFETTGKVYTSPGDHWRGEYSESIQGNGLRRKNLGRPQQLEAKSPAIVEYFKNYVQNANNRYVGRLYSLARERQIEEARVLQQEIATRERRQRIPSKLKI